MEQDGEEEVEAVAVYQYDGRNYRVQKTVDEDTYDYYYNEDWQLLEARMGGDADPQEQYVWGQAYIDAPVVRFYDADVDAADIVDEYYTRDANFNTTAKVDASDGSVISSYVYTPYGEVMFLDADWNPRSQTADDNDALFAGYRFDTETEYALARNRYYDAALGGWITRDPIEADINTFRYGSSSPLNRRDSLGLSDIVSNVWSESVSRNLPNFMLRRFFLGQIFRRFGSSSSGPAYNDKTKAIILDWAEFDILADPAKHGPITSINIAHFYNEAFAAWMHQSVYPNSDAPGTVSGKEAQWLIDLMAAENYPTPPPDSGSRSTKYDYGLDMAEEAMSETLARVIQGLASGNIAGTAVDPSLAASPDHDGYQTIPLPFGLSFTRNEKWRGVAGSGRKISNTLFYAVMWTQHFGYQDPRTVLPPSLAPPQTTIPVALKNWFNATYPAVSLPIDKYKHMAPRPVGTVPAISGTAP